MSNNYKNPTKEKSQERHCYGRYKQQGNEEDFTVLIGFGKKEEIRYGKSKRRFKRQKKT